MHLVGNNSSMQPTPLWSVGKSSFLHDVYFLKHSFLPMLLVFAIKCCTKMPFPLPHNHYCCSLPNPSPACLSHLFICTCIISSPNAWPPSSALCWCFFLLFYFFLIFVICYISFNLCDSILACLCTYFLFQPSFSCCVTNHNCSCINIVFCPCYLFLLCVTAVLWDKNIFCQCCLSNPMRSLLTMHRSKSFRLHQAIQLLVINYDAINLLEAAWLRHNRNSNG